MEIRKQYYTILNNFYRDDIKIQGKENELGLELVSRDFKENVGFQVIYESIKVVERQVGLSFKDNVNMAMTARSLGSNTGEDTGLP